ncbi:hypothetical protein F5Y17DRAFT_80351 [Xylariaceae sp. FL0594]|nr:hypothetical protein F5Y17DRAFT_80351 [Xylariaceae sp. FL0594]
MVSLDIVQASNARIKSDLPSGLVAVFIGATSGIGEATPKHFVKHAAKPRVYFTGRRRDVGLRVQAELQQLNPGGEYFYLQHDSSLLRNVDALCRDIRDREDVVNLLCITMGTLRSGTTTEEGLHYAMALSYYCRMRFVVNLLPLIRKANALRRVITVFADTKEGTVYPSDFPAFKLSLTKARGHIASMITLALEHLSKHAPEVSFIHDYPGFVKTELARELDKSLTTSVVLGVLGVVGLFLNTSIEEVGERHYFLATSAMFPPQQSGGASGVSLSSGHLRVAVSTDGKTGGGVYTVDNKNEPGSQEVRDILAEMRKDGIADQAWKHLETEFLRVTGSTSI